MRKVNIALIDSGTTLKCKENITVCIQDGIVSIKPQESIDLLHGDTIAKIIDDEFVTIYDIQVFTKTLTTSPLQIYTALEYLLDKDIDIISMSLGLTTNYEEIEDICQKLLAKGVTIIASYPRSGETEVFPASYDGVLKVTADGKCEGYEISILDDNLFGANPHSNIKGLSGSSIAVAKFTKKYSSYLATQENKTQILQRIKNEIK